jgi:hypothetical protein
MEEDKPAIDDLEANFRLDFATLPNPLDEFSPFAGVPPTAAYTICREGTSFWPDIEKDPWCKVSQRWIPVVSPLDVFLIPLYSRKRTEPFINHIATLQDGFRSYQRIPEEVRKRDKSKDADIAPHVRKKLPLGTPDHEIEDAIVDKIISVRRNAAFNTFIRYALSVSHVKMRARASHSTSTKYFQTLCSISAERLDAAFLDHWHNIEVTAPNRTRDIPLCTTILALEPDTFEMIVNFLKHDLQFNMEPGFRFGKLCAAFQELSKFHQLGDDKDMKNCPPIYTPETAVEFHYLLLGTIAGFKSTLNSFNLSPESEPSDKRTLYDVCWKLAHLLWRISHSSIL